MVELCQIVRGVNVSFDTAVCPSAHKVCVWWQTDGDVPAHSRLLAPISFGRCAREREALTEGTSRSAALKLIGGPLIMERRAKTKRTRWEKSGFLYAMSARESAGNTMMYVCKRSVHTVHTAQSGPPASPCTAAVGPCLTWEVPIGEKQEIGCSLLTAALCYLLPFLFASSFPFFIPRGGWVRANLIERQINKEIYCHLGAPSS